MTGVQVALIAFAGVGAIVGLIVAVLVIEARAIERAGDALGDGESFRLTEREWDQIQAAHFDGPEPLPHRRNGEP